MFEKEAKRSFDELDDRGIGDDWSIEDAYENGFSNGAEFGYNKAHEWIYCKDRLPEDESDVLCLIWKEESEVGYYSQDKNQWHTIDGEEITPIAWMLIQYPEGDDECRI